jgi:hypothetical protein
MMFCSTSQIIRTVISVLVNSLLRNGRTPLLYEDFILDPWHDWILHRVCQQSPRIQNHLTLSGPLYTLQSPLLFMHQR